MILVESGTNQNFLVKSTRILVEITEILIDYSGKNTNFSRFYHIVSIRILVISIRILLNLTRKFGFVHFQPEIFFSDTITIYF